MLQSALLPCLLCLLAITATRTVKGEDDAYNEATQELLEILQDHTQYNSDVMPTNESGGPVAVKLQMFLRNVEVDDEQMTTTVEMTFRMLWNDNRLAYSQTDVEYVNFVDTYKLWLPDPFFKNAIDTKLMSSVYPEAYARVNDVGDITYSARMRVVLRCIMDLSRFPHDQQVCPILIASYGYNDKHMTFEMDQDIDMADNLMYTSRFTFDGFETTTCDSTTKTGTYSCVQVDMTLDRVSSTYSMEFYIPFIFLVIVAFFSEIIPAGALLPRLLLTLVPLVTLAAFYFAYSVSLPAVSYARACDIFAGISMLVNFGLLVHTIVAYYRSLIDVAEKRILDLEGGELSSKSVFSTIMAVFDRLFLAMVIIFYIIFFICYFAAYGA